MGRVPEAAIVFQILSNNSMLQAGCMRAHKDMLIIMYAVPTDYVCAMPKSKHNPSNLESCYVELELAVLLSNIG